MAPVENKTYRAFVAHDDHTANVVVSASSLEDAHAKVLAKLADLDWSHMEIVHVSLFVKCAECADAAFLGPLCLFHQRKRAA
jgi:hypothetical protein